MAGCAPAGYEGVELPDISRQSSTVLGNICTGSAAVRTARVLPRSGLGGRLGRKGALGGFPGVELPLAMARGGGGGDAGGLVWVGWLCGRWSVGGERGLGWGRNG